MKPCRSPYCECAPGTCSHPGCYDARGDSSDDPRNKSLAAVFEGQSSDETRTKDPLREALQAYEHAFSEMFAQCCSNPIFDAWGNRVPMNLFNTAHHLAEQALKK